MAKIDLEDAFKHIKVRKEDWALLGSSWTSKDESGKEKRSYFVDTVLPFGCRSSPKLFNMFADALSFCMTQNGVTETKNYLDDYFTCGKVDSDECSNNLNLMQETCKEIGFSVQASKVVGPSSVLEYIGIVIDTNACQLRISEERLEEIMKDLQKWLTRQSCTKRQLLSIIGKLVFVSKVVKSGRTFVRRMIQLSKKARFLHSHVKLSREFKLDVEWWLKYLRVWNGISWFKDQAWSSNEHLHLWTDASDLGYGAIFENEWIMQPFCKEYKYKSITWRELYAIVKATATWGKQLSKRRIRFHCDNEAVVFILQTGTSKCPQIMNLVRSLFYICEQFNIECSAEHIPGLKNEIADALSRLELSKFLLLVPHANIIPTLPSTIYY